MKFVRPRCYFDVELSDIPLGRIVFELYSDICPITCENFRALCTGEKGIGKTTGKNLHYQNIVFHRVVRGFMIQSGDFSIGNGTGGESIYGGTFEDENFALKHDEPFLLSMANRGKDTNGSQFFITTQPAPHLDGIHVVFGHVVSGQSVVTHIENLPVDKMSRPLQDVRVMRCNELMLKSKLKAAKEKRKVSSEESESEEEEEEKEKEEGEQSDSDKEKKKKKKRKEKKKHKKKKKKSRKQSGDSSESGDNSGSGADSGSDSESGRRKRNVNPITGTVSKIVDPSEIPDVPANKFLYRGGAREGEKREERGRERRGAPPAASLRANRDRKRENIRGYTKSGRVIKGRGVFRYRTPSRSRSRSFTPPHWKQAETRTIKLAEFQKLEQEKQLKEEEIRRREEARKKRHEELKMQRMTEEEERKKNRTEEQTEEESIVSAKPQRLRRTAVTVNRVTTVHDRLTTVHAKTNPGVMEDMTGPVDYNALDYDDEADPEEPPPPAKEKTPHHADKQGQRYGSGHESEGDGENKENKGEVRETIDRSTELFPLRSDAVSPPPNSAPSNQRPLTPSPSPETKRKELERLLLDKLAAKRMSGAGSTSRSKSRENGATRRRTVSRSSRDKTNKADGKDSDKKLTSSAQNGNTARDKFKTTRKQSPSSRSRSRDKKRDRRDRGKDRSRSRSRKRRRGSGERKSRRDGRKRSRSRSRDRKRSRSRSKDRKRSRSRSKDRKRSRSPGSKRTRSRSKDRKRSQSPRKRSRSRSKDRKRGRSTSSKRKNSAKVGGKEDEASRRNEEARSEEAKRKLTERLKELEKARKARLSSRGGRSSSSSSSSGSD